MRRLLPLLLLTVAAPAVGQALTSDASRALVTPELRELPTRTVGRVQQLPLAAPMPKGSVAFLHQWPGVYWEARVKGDHVVLSFDDPWNGYRLLVDGTHPLAIAEPGRAQVAVTGLGPGVHTLRLETLTEMADHAGTFEGFYAPRAARQPPPPPRAIQIEWIGDSSMSGYGDRSPANSCTSDQIRRFTDTQAAYPALVSNRLGADYEVNAVSGRGMVRNYADFDEGHGLPSLYPFTFTDRTVPVVDPGWHPNLFVVRLWADFVTPLKPGELWPSDPALARDYAQTAMRLVRDLHTRSPGAAVLFWWFDTARDVPDPRARALLDGIPQMVVADAHAAGVQTILFAPFPPARFEGTACDHHGSVADHARMADAVTEFLHAHPELLPGATLSPADRPSDAPARP